MPIPDLPQLAAESSLLSQKFGPEIANYFSGSPLNRLSFLRTDHAFLQAAFTHPSASFLLMNELAPLVTAGDSSQLAFVSSSDVTGLTGPEPFVKTEDELIKGFNSTEDRPVILFLGVDEAGSLPSHTESKLLGEEFAYKDYKGIPYFAVEVTPRGTLTGAADGVIAGVKAKGFVFHDASPRHMGLHSGQGNFLYFPYTSVHER